MEILLHPHYLRNTCFITYIESIVGCVQKKQNLFDLSDDSCSTFSQTHETGNGVFP